MEWFVWFGGLPCLQVWVEKKMAGGGYCKRGWRWSPLTSKGRAHWDHLLLGTAIAMGRYPHRPSG